MTDEDRRLLYALTDLVLMLVDNQAITMKWALEDEIRALRVLTDPLEDTFYDLSKELLKQKQEDTTP